MIRLTRAHTLPIGVDIGHDSVKMLQVEAVGTSLEVTAAAKMPLPPEVKSSPELRVPMASDLIKQMLRQHPFRGRQIVAALPREIIHMKNLRLPQMPTAELAAVVRFEARNVFPFDTDQAKVHFLAAGEVRQGAEVRQEVILLAAKNEDVNNVVEQLHRAGVIIESLDVEACAVYRSLERFIRRKEDENDVNVLVDVGVKRSQMVIGRGRDISFIKQVEIGGFHFHDAVSRKLGITLEEAEALRRRLIEAGEPADPAARRDPVRQAVFDATRAPMEELGREISLCLRYFSVTFRGHRPTKLRLIGGEACDPQLQTLLNTALVIPVEIGKPLFSVNTSKMKPTDRRGAMCEWALALGLCLRTTQTHFGPRDGRPRDPASLGQPGGTTTAGAEVVDLSAAVRATAETIEAPSGATISIRPAQRSRPMRDMEFLPDWYPQTRRRRRLVVLMGWLTLLLIAGMGLHRLLVDRNIAAADKSLGSLREQLDQTNAQLVEMDKLDSMRQQLRQQQQIVSRLGFYVNACKAIDSIDGLMPRQMSLTGMQLENEEKVDTSAIQQAKVNAEVTVDRHLKVKIQGVCPTDVDLANFMTQLSTIAFFDQVSVTYARDKSDNGHVLREFEVSFMLNLNVAGS